ncbi:hypothetical protein [Exiguobacterium sp.]|uniref:hypothetical protein n=1 Tax=Exiguobacterium sp. TaxID=44751 RepID=UPI00263B8D0C|nr:hypothetical protein [Exiguobacterium sp.]MCC5892016.1 hypothetical protein [Exiguobacterium sp.]
MSRWLLIGLASLITALIHFLLSPNLPDVNESIWLGGTVGLLLLSVMGFSTLLGQKHHWTYRQRFVVGIGLIVAFALSFSLILWWVVAVNLNQI